LTRTTVSTIVAKYIDNGLVVESGFSPSTGGKPATLLQVDEKARNLIGLDLSEREFFGALVNLRGEIVQRASIPLSQLDGDSALNLVYVLVDRLLQESKVDVVGIGVGTPGLMIPSTGVVLRSINLDWDDMPLGQLLSQRFYLPVYAGNDCQAAAMGEFIWGEPRDSEHLILIKVGSGIGAGIIINGCSFHGDGNGAGEIGHIQVVRDGLQCRCGNIGCLETVLSENALIRAARDVAEVNPATVLNQLCSKPENISMHTVKTAYELNDESVVGLVHQAASELGKVVAHMVGVLNINHIRIAGRLCFLGKGLMDPIHEQLIIRTLPGLSKQIDVRFSKLGDDIVIQGAASMVLKNELGMM
jgi:predicted NBD/HSP70 family sugar kinase